MGLIKKNGIDYGVSDPVDLTGYVTDRTLEEKIKNLKSDEIKAADGLPSISMQSEYDVHWISVKTNQGRELKINEGRNGIEFSSNYRIAIKSRDTGEKGREGRIFLSATQGVNVEGTLRATKNLLVGGFTERNGEKVPAGAGHLDVAGEARFFNQVKIDNSLQVGTSLTVQNDFYVNGSGNPRIAHFGDERILFNRTLEVNKEICIGGWNQGANFGELFVKTDYGWYVHLDRHGSLHNLQEIYVSGTAHFDERVKIRKSLMPEYGSARTINVKQQGSTIHEIGIGDTVHYWGHAFIAKYHDVFNRRHGDLNGVGIAPGFTIASGSGANGIYIPIETIKKECAKRYMTSKATEDCLGKTVDEFYREYWVHDLMVVGTLTFTCRTVDEDGGVDTGILHLPFALMGNGDDMESSFNNAQFTVNEYHAWTFGDMDNYAGVWINGGNLYVSAESRWGRYWTAMMNIECCGSM